MGIGYLGIGASLTGAVVAVFATMFDDIVVANTATTAPGKAASPRGWVPRKQLRRPDVSGCYPTLCCEAHWKCE